MKIREKTMAIVGVTFIFLFVLLVVATDQIVGNSFEQLENKEVSKNMGRAVEAISTKLESLNSSVSDYAVWDGSYRFVQGQYESYINDTYSADAVTSLDVNMILFYDSRNKLYYATAVEKGTTKHENVSNAMLDFIASNELLFSHSAPNSHVSGIINSPEGPLLIASHAITQSSGEEPIVGTLIFAKHFDDKVIKELAETTHLSLSVEPFNKERAASYASATSSPSRQDNSFNVNYVSETSFIGTKVMNDINGNPVLSLNVEMPRDTYQEGRSAIKYMLIAILFMGLLFELVLAFSLDKSVLSRISFLNTNLKAITEKGSLSSRINIEGEDEICDLTGNINHMLKTLEEKEEILETFDIIESSLESMNAGVMIAGMNSRVIMNNKFIEMWGISANLLPQKSAEKIIEHVIAQAEDGKGGTLKLKELKSASDRDQVTLYLRNNGSVYDWYAGPLLQHGKMIGTVYCTTDITSVKLRALEEENRKRLETIFSRIISGVLLIDAETSVIV
ncbi:MAG TPA: CHASE4 domain-containing protein, partial [Methanosarcina sp.]|nr:CHASE4 domain-containing protein [Methanosarcina sp.]